MRIIKLIIEKYVVKSAKIFNYRIQWPNVVKIVISFGFTQKWGAP